MSIHSRYGLELLQDLGGSSLLLLRRCMCYEEIAVYL